MALTYLRSTYEISTIEIVLMEKEHYPQVAQIQNDGFGSKCLFCCIPNIKSSSDFTRSFKRKPKKKELAFVAIDTTTSTVVGFVQMSKPGVPDFWGMHTCKDNEVWIDQIGVSSEARGRGVGTKLLKHCEDFARNEAGIEVLTLEVLKGNRALGLYERFGFEKVPEDLLSRCITSFFVFAVMGRPYGLCHPEWGAIQMVKKL